MQQDNLFSNEFSIDEVSQQPGLVDSSNINTQWLEQHFAVKPDSDLPDGLARFQGVHPHHSFIVQAPAGSGKTSLLAQRFLALLSQVESPEQIVAMTFTKKAAAEMRERIVEALMLGEKVLPADATLVEANTWKLAQKALQRDRDQAWSLLKNPNRLRIKTIDGLNSYLVGQMPLLSKMGGQSQLLQDATPAYQEAVRQVLKMPELEEQVGRLLRLVNGRFNRAESLLIGMLAKRDQWMRTLIQYQGDEAREVLEAAIEEIVSKTLSEQLKGLYYLKEAFQEACSIAEYAVKNDQPQLAALCGAWPIAEDSSETEKWRVLADWVLTKDNKSIRKRLTKNEGFPPGKGEAKEQKERFADVLEQIRVAAANHSEILPGLVTLKTLPEPDYSDEQWQDLQWLIQLLTISTGFLKLVFQQTGQSDYIETAQAASQALGSELEPTDLAQQLDYQIQHLLVDEFQDTSSEQYKLLKQLIAGWQPDDGRTLFLVGDPMQSIYRFREAEVGNFLEAWKGEIGTVQLNQLNLKVNFRSTAGVVNWVNQAFAKILPKEDAKEKGAVSYSDSIAYSEDQNQAVTTHWALNQSPHEEALEILTVIQKRLAEFAESEVDNAEAKNTSLQKTAKLPKIAILGRSRSSLMGIAQLLKQQQIGFRAVDLENLSERQEVQDVLALSRSLLHLADRAAWIALLRSPLVGLNLKDIYAVIGNHPFQTAWYAIECFRCKDAKQSNHQAWCFGDVPNLSEIGVLRLEKSIPIIDNALKRLGSLSFSTLVRETWLQLDGPQTVENALALENVDVFCQTLASNDGELLDIKQLEKQMETLFARPDSAPESQRIELMTMHKSKGLEFDTVILPGLGRKPRGDDAELVSWFQFLGESGDEQLVIAPIDQKGQKTSSLRTLLKSFEAEKQRYELGRLLYVAATRAKKQLHLFAQVKYQPTEKNLEKGDYTITPTKESLLESLWSYAQKDFEELADGYNPLDRQEQEVDIPWPKVSRLPVERTGFSEFKAEPLFITARATEASQSTVLSSDLVEQDLAAAESAGLVFDQQNALLNTTVGNLVHAIFEQMVIDGIEQWNQVKLNQMLPGYELWLLQNGLPEKDLPEAMRRVKQSVNHALNNSKVCWALQSSLPESATEFPLTSQEDGVVANHIVDRTFIDKDGTRWIVDYKTSVNDDDNIEAFIEYQTKKYQPQLARYGRLFDQLETRPQKWVLYFSYLDVWHELH